MTDKSYKYYNGFEISKKYNWKTRRKDWSVIYGAGLSKTTGYFETKKVAKLFIDWIVKSDYARIDTKYSRDSYWKYQDELKKL